MSRRLEILRHEARMAELDRLAARHASIQRGHDDPFVRHNHCFPDGSWIKICDDGSEKLIGAPKKAAEPDPTRAQEGKWEPEEKSEPPVWMSADQKPPVEGKYRVGRGECHTVIALWYIPELGWVANGYNPDQVRAYLQTNGLEATMSSRIAGLQDWLWQPAP